MVGGIKLEKGNKQMTEAAPLRHESHACTYFYCKGLKVFNIGAKINVKLNTFILTNNKQRQIEEIKHTYSLKHSLNMPLQTKILVSLYILISSHLH